jgi:hypothetical protein
MWVRVEGKCGVAEEGANEFGPARDLAEPAAATAGMTTALHPAESPPPVGGYGEESKYELRAGAFVVIASTSSSVSS